MPPSASSMVSILPSASIGFLLVWSVVKKHCCSFWRLAELCPQFLEQLYSIRSQRLAEVEKDLEADCPCSVIELKAQSVDPVQVTRLLYGEGRSQFLPANVHIERVALHIEKWSRLAEAVELTFHLRSGAAIGH